MRHAICNELGVLVEALPTIIVTMQIVLIIQFKEPHCDLI